MTDLVGRLLRVTKLQMLIKFTSGGSPPRPRVYIDLPVDEADI